MYNKYTKYIKQIYNSIASSETNQVINLLFQIENGENPDCDNQNLLRPSLSNLSPISMLSPIIDSNPAHSHSLTRISRHTPYRFNSLTTQLSEDSSPYKNQNSLSVRSAAETNMSPSTSNNNLLSPNNIMSISNSNLNQYLSAAAANSSNMFRTQHQPRNQEQTLKLMQKKYSKSVDAYRADSSVSQSPKLLNTKFNTSNAADHAQAQTTRDG